MARLIWMQTDSPTEDTVFEIGEAPLVVGRDPSCGIFINAPLLSRQHARIEAREAGHVIIDLDSTNFTKVNGERVSGERALRAGDEVRFSRVVCVYEA